ncbi:MAG: putative phage abortive infection protein [Bacteroidota bacterium]
MQSSNRRVNPNREKKRNLFDALIKWIDKNQIRAFCLFALGIIVVFFVIPPLLTKVPGIIEFNDKTGAIGDTIGGTIGPVVAFLAAVLTFFAFWIQYQANQQQKNYLQHERFESKFFEMLRLHKENITEMVIEGYDLTKTKTITSSSMPGSGFTKETTIEAISKIISGRQVFVTTYSELVACYEICAATLLFDEFKGKDRYLIKMAYRFLFNGIDSDIINQIDEKIVDDKIYVEKCKKELRKASQQHISTSGENNVYEVPLSNIKIEIPIKYKPFAGHSSRFGHYFRHLFLMVKYVAKQYPFPHDYNKRDYFRMIRAQLSDHEQLMLYFNYLSEYGENWEKDENKYFSDFRMIHNLPIELTEFTIKPKDEFSKQISIIKEQDEEMFAFYE